MDYTVSLFVFLFSFLLEITILYLLKKNSHMSKYVAVVTVSVVMFAASSYVFLTFSTVTIFLLLVSLFRCVNLARVVFRRMHKNELTQRYKRSFVWLGLISIAIVLFMHTETVWISMETFLYVSFFGSLVLFVTTFISMFRWRNRHVSNSKIMQVPTVSVCIPARNETQDLPECIESILSSSYPKLEVLVLDDCSHDKTPAVIKEYAHRGVRFIKGQEPSSDWIAKNSAMNKLMQESRGEIVIFVGVDVRFSSNTVLTIIEQLEHGLLDMISVLPQRSGKSENSVFIQPLRYWWELSVPRLFGKRPPAISTLWAVRRKKLQQVGGFISVKKSIRPEAHFAKRLQGAYRFVISGSKLGVSSSKEPREQLDTALRMRYPQARRRPESVLLLLFIELVIFGLPLIALFSGIVIGDNSLVYISGTTMAMLLIVNVYISFLTVKKTWILGLVTLPFLLFEEWYILIRSMIAYEFGSVKWKERNICLPMLQVEKELPKI
jgi:glycosyltransferase involved in cell wall biosynthesis